MASSEKSVEIKSFTKNNKRKTGAYLSRKKKKDINRSTRLKRVDVEGKRLTPREDER